MCGAPPARGRGERESGVGSQGSGVRRRGGGWGGGETRPSRGRTYGGVGWSRLIDRGPGGPAVHALAQPFAGFDVPEHPFGQIHHQGSVVTIGSQGFLRLLQLFEHGAKPDQVGVLRGHRHHGEPLVLIDL